MTEAPFNIAAAFRQKQAMLTASFLAIRDVTKHSTVLGDELEADWVGLIRDFLPTRYCVGPIFAVDHRGNMSEQIDVAVYDTHYSPQWFGAAGSGRFVPVESVYAVFESKPEFNAKYLAAARQKAASVRRLERTSEAIIYQGGVYEAHKIALKPIIAGILTVRAGWADGVEKMKETQPASSDAGFLNIGVCLEQFAFDYTPTSIGDGTVEVLLDQAGADDALIHFATRLFRQLQAIGTVPAVRMPAYEANLRRAVAVAADQIGG